MKLTLSPFASDYTTKVVVDGLKLIIDGEEYDLSEIPQGGQAEVEEDNKHLIGIVTRDSATVIYHYDRTKAEPHQSSNIEDYIFDVTDGEAPCPIKWRV